MDNGTTIHSAIIAPVPLDFKQLLLFTTCEVQINERGKTTSVTFEREVQIIHTGSVNGLYKFQVFLYEADYIFNRASEPYYELLKKIGMALDELVLLVNKEGILTAIHNFPFVKYQWENIREQLILEFEGELFEKHIAFMDEMMTDHNNVLRYLCTPSMYGLYFNGCWGMHKLGENDCSTMFYDRELQNITVSEKIDLHSSNNNRYVQLDVSISQPTEGIVRYLGSYVYADGILDEATKEIGIDVNKTIKYSAKWVGLKCYIPKS